MVSENEVSDTIKAQVDAKAEKVKPEPLPEGYIRDGFYLLHTEFKQLATGTDGKPVRFRTSEGAINASALTGNPDAFVIVQVPKGRTVYWP